MDGKRKLPAILIILDDCYSISSIGIFLKANSALQCSIFSSLFIEWLCSNTTPSEGLHILKEQVFFWYTITKYFPTLDEHRQGPGHLFYRLNSLSLTDQVRSPWAGGNSSEETEDMPGRRKRTSPTLEESRSKKPKYSQSQWPRRGQSSESFSGKQCIAWFHEYTDPDEDTLGPEGMEKFCEDIGVEPENIVMLSLAYKLDAKTMGFFTLAEWLKGMTELQCDTITKLQQKLDYLRSLLEDSVQFKNIYRFAFDFARDKDQRSMDLDTAKAMLALLLGKKWSLFGSFHQYLDQSKYKVINKDQWCNILEFSRSISPDLTNYDEDGAWPVLLDEFVDWYKEQRSMTS